MVNPSVGRKGKERIVCLIQTQKANRKQRDQDCHQLPVKQVKVQQRERSQWMQMNQ